jgi:hypothetical protein
VTGPANTHIHLPRDRSATESAHNQPAPPLLKVMRAKCLDCCAGKRAKFAIARQRHARFGHTEWEKTRTPIAKVMPRPCGQARRTPMTTRHRPKTHVESVGADEFPRSNQRNFARGHMPHQRFTEILQIFLLA